MPGYGQLRFVHKYLRSNDQHLYIVSPFICHSIIWVNLTEILSLDFCQTEVISMLHNELIRYEMAERSQTSKEENKSIKINIILKIVSLFYFMVSEINILTKFRKTICYTFKINCTSFKKMHGFSINMQYKIICRIKCKLPFCSWPVIISILTTCVI